MEVNKEQVMKEEDEDEELYEKIEAPKFVDFTKLHTLRTDDDRYWFCSRVGCDQKHEEEINHEEISKNFVFRVLAARSPNIKLRKALYKEHCSMNCPLSAPAKPSKPKIPRLAMDASLISYKNGDPQSKNGPCSTLMTKSRQVASKYMTTVTTPRNKISQHNQNSFLSVENTKTNIVDVPTSQTVAKALVNGDPHNKTGPGPKVGSTPVARTRQVAARYMTTPRKKMSQPNYNSFLSVPNSKAATVDVPKSRKVAKGLVFRSPTKGITLKKSVELHTPLTKICEGMKRLEIASQKKILKGSRSKPKKPEPEDSSSKLKICKSEKMDLASASHEQVVDVKLSDESASECSKKEENLEPQVTSDTSETNTLRAEMNDLSNIEDKENIDSPEDNSNVDGKENALNAQENNRSNNQPFGDKILSKEIQKKNKIVQTAGPAVTKCKKPMPTNIKPFRLRTDERGILKEAIQERKSHFTVPEKEVAKDTCVIKMTYRVTRDEKLSTSDNIGKVPVAVRSKAISNNALRCPESTQQRSMTSLKTRSQSVRMPGQQLGAVEENSKLTSVVKVVGNKTRAVSATRSTSRGKRPVTVAKELNFHTSHLPRTCSKKIA
ncbi:hypothetical protein M8C21_026850 [Ambrosia artemisiifolia]|uniref:Uncharacterized protein n=1 Tax=Ambrosia artemisiifolia TaxID=4212 RepID=A0AAD5CT10_AMBAR|nr:hypothetical protein M8C21_026850 [Ambrosia artemisiifolia]